MRRAFITGITGQDGSYLARFLLDKGYEVHGMVRRSSTFNTVRIDDIYEDPHDPASRIFLHHGDLTDGAALRRLLERTLPDEVYNLGAQSHVMVSFEQPQYTADVVATGTLRLLEALRDHITATGREVRFYQAGSSEMFGSAPPPQNEQTPFHPRSPYAASKVAGYWYSLNYREAYDLFIANGILFNHESPMRGETFVTRKITRALTRIKLGLERKLYLGNLEARRDWGYAEDYVEAMWLILQQPEPDDYVIATGEAFSVRDFLDEAARCLEIEWRDVVEIDRRYMRPAEVDVLIGDASKARARLGWRPKIRFPKLVRMMVEHDLGAARQELLLKDAGHAVAARGLSYA